MGHHYLPQHYLRGFASGKAIWAHDLQEKRSFRTRIKSVANETALYTEDLEAHLANFVEGPAQSAIDKLRRLEELSSKDREVLARYIIAMWKRVPAARKRVAATIPGVADKIKAEFQQANAKAVEENPDLANLASSRKGEVEAIISRYKQDPPNHFWHHIVGTEATPRMVLGLLEMSWTVLVSESERFIASDNPVFFFESEGIGSPYSELSAPLSSGIALWAARGRQPKPNFMPVDRNIVMEVNRRSASKAGRYLYTEQEAPWALRFGNKPHVLDRLW